MRNTHIFITAILAATLACGCGGKKSQDADADEVPVQKQLEIKGDSMLYGLTCDGTTDSVVVIWPFEGEPKTYSCFDAKRNERIIGKPQIGDWIGVMIDPEDTTEVTMVINLDQLKGTWTYPVLPVMKDLQHMSRRMQRRMMANMPDSVKETFFVPREYGFTLKRSHVAQPVGRIRRANTLEDDSPVQYPDVRNYREWHMLNGNLVLVSGGSNMPGVAEQKQEKDEIDTLQFVYMDEDSLILTQHGIRYGFHRKTNAIEANAAASKAQARQDSKK